MTAAVFDEFRRHADGLPIFVWMQQPDGQIDWANRAWNDFVALPHDVARSSEGWARVVHPDDIAGLLATTSAAMGDASTYEAEYRVKPSTSGDGEYRWILARATPRFDENGRITHWLGVGTDITQSPLCADERTAVVAELVQHEARALRIIADGMPLLMWAMRADGSIDWYNQRWYAYTGQTTDEALGTGWQSVVHPDDRARVTNDWQHAIANGEPFAAEARLRGADGRYRLFVTRATPVRDRSGSVVRWFGTHADIERESELRQHERQIAQTFQRAALQVRLPAVVGLTMDSLYEPGRNDALAGGDWFDVFRLVDGRVVFSVGDVAASGLQAAVTMGSLRQSIRTAALINPDPVAVLDAVDRIVRDMSPDLLATAFVAIFDPVHGEVRYALAGHPPPLLRSSDGSVVTLGNVGLPLGLRQRSFEPAPAVTIVPGMLLVMYTDGLTEAERRPLTGEAAVAAVVRELDPDDRPAHALYRAIVPPDGPHDDVAILTVRFAEQPVAEAGRRGIWNWTFDATDAQAASQARLAIGSILAAGGMAADDVTSAELVFAELIGNVLRHASRRVRVALDQTGEHPVLHVLDEGKGFEHNPRLPSDLLAERGRGLYIVSHLAEELSITRRTAGGSHMRAVLAGRMRRAASG